MANSSSAINARHAPAQGSLAAAGTQHPSILTGPSGQNLLHKAGTASISNQHAQGISDNVEAKGARQGVTGAGRAEYRGASAGDFPDSTKNAALISPPDPANSPVFTFDPTFASRGFPDLANYGFLQPNLRGGLKSSRMQEKEDLYERIERRLNEYRQSETKAPPSNGIKKENLRRPTGLTNPFSTEHRRSEP